MKIDIRFVETGEIRPPLVSEWFRDSATGCAKQALFDFTIQKFPILKMILTEEGD